MAAWTGEQSVSRLLEVTGVGMLHTLSPTRSPNPSALSCVRGRGGHAQAGALSDRGRATTMRMETICSITTT